MEVEKVQKNKPHDKLMAYKTLVIVNLCSAILMFVVHLMMSTSVSQLMGGRNVGVDGPTAYAAVFMALIAEIAIIILLVAPGLITIYQSVKLIKRKLLTTSSIWFILAVIGVGVEIVMLV